jgi:hypothetical protein
MARAGRGDVGRSTAESQHTVSSYGQGAHWATIATACYDASNAGRASTSGSGRFWRHVYIAVSEPPPTHLFQLQPQLELPGHVIGTRKVPGTGRSLKGHRVAWVPYFSLSGGYHKRIRGHRGQFASPHDACHDR